MAKKKEIEYTLIIGNKEEHGELEAITGTLEELEKNREAKKRGK